jgi:hypothetical protein
MKKKEGSVNGKEVKNKRELKEKSSGRRERL